jgi:hypothetical protein
MTQNKCTPYLLVHDSPINVTCVIQILPVLWGWIKLLNTVSLHLLHTDTPDCMCSPGKPEDCRSGTSVSINPQAFRQVFESGFLSCLSFVGGNGLMRSLRRLRLILAIVELVTLILRIRLVQGSSLSTETYPVCGVSWFSLSFLPNFRTILQTMLRLLIFQIVSNSLLINRPTIRSYVVWDTDSVVK